jgi:hypothetical protein
MKTTLKITLSVIIAFVLTMSAACTKKEVEFFHGEEPQFKPGPPGGAALVEINEKVDFKAYKTIIIDPVYFSFASTNQYNAIPPDTLKDLRDTFDKAFIAALKGAYPLVKQPRPDAMRVRVAILDVVPLIQDTSISETPISLGGASIKAEFLDSMTNERLGAVMDAKTGNENKAVKSGDEWENTKDVFKYWAQRLRNWLDTNLGK